MLIQQIKQHAPIVLVENQGNVNENAAQPVDIEAAKAFAEQRGMGYIQVNTDTNPVDNAEQVFEDLADRVLKAFQETFGLTDGSNVKKVM